MLNNIIANNCIKIPIGNLPNYSIISAKQDFNIFHGCLLCHFSNRLYSPILNTIMKIQSKTTCSTTDLKHPLDGFRNYLIYLRPGVLVITIFHYNSFQTTTSPILFSENRQMFLPYETQKATP